MTLLETKRIMNFNSNIQHRRSIRLKNYDYSTKGLYFITICTHGHHCLFGKIDGVNSVGMQLNNYGKIVQYTWFDLVNHVDNIKLHEFIVMPNHVHGIIEIVTKSVGVSSKPALGYQPPCHNYGNGGKIESETGANLEKPGLHSREGLEPAPTRLADSLHAELKPNHQVKTKPLYEIVRQLKTFSARRINLLRKAPENPLWQRNYYDNVIRNETAYVKISEYILNNPRS